LGWNSGFSSISVCLRKQAGITVAGTVPDFHRVPFQSPCGEPVTSYSDVLIIDRIFVKEKREGEIQNSKIQNSELILPCNVILNLKLIVLARK